MNSRQKLIEDNMKLVYHVISTYYPTFVNNEDLQQTGMVGLCKAADTWDESKSTFSTYACKCILNEIRMEFRRSRKHTGLLSLDYLVTNGEGDVVTQGDLLVGDEDIDFVDYEAVKSFYDDLSERDKAIIDGTIAGVSQKKIADRFGVKQSTIAMRLRRLRLLWRKINGD